MESFFVAFYVNTLSFCGRTSFCGQCGKVCGFIHTKNAYNMSFPQSYSHYPQLLLRKIGEKRRTNVFFVEIRKARKTAILYFVKKWEKQEIWIMETVF